MKALLSYIALCLLAGMLAAGALLALPGLVLVVWGAYGTVKLLRLPSAAHAPKPLAPHRILTDIPLMELLKRAGRPAQANSTTSPAPSTASSSFTKGAN